MGRNKSLLALFVLLLVTPLGCVGHVLVEFGDCFEAGLGTGTALGFEVRMTDVLTVGLGYVHVHDIGVWYGQSGYYEDYTLIGLGLAYLEDARTGDLDTFSWSNVPLLPDGMTKPPWICKNRHGSFLQLLRFRIVVPFLFATLRLGFHLGEFIDFLGACIGLDILGDDDTS